MKRKFLSFLIMFTLILSVNISEVEASSGKLRSASICQNSNGTYYGQHSSDNHWHVAAHRSKGWYAQGSPVSKPACAGGVSHSSSSSSKKSSSSSKKSSSSSKKSSSSNYVYSTKSSVATKNVEAPKSNEKPKITNEDFVTIKRNKIDVELDKEKILGLLDVKVTDKEDGEISNDDIVVTPNKILKDDVGVHDITIAYKDEDGNKVEEKAIIEVKEDGKPIITTDIDEISIYGYEIPETLEEFEKLIGLSVSDEEDGEIELKENNITLDEKDQLITLKIIDSDGNSVEKTLKYTIEKVTLFSIVLSLALLSGIVYAIYRLFKKIRLKKSNKN